MEAANRACWAVFPWPSERISFSCDYLRPGFDFSNHLKALEDVVHEWFSLTAYRMADASKVRPCKTD